MAKKTPAKRNKKFSPNVPVDFAIKSTLGMTIEAWDSWDYVYSYVYAEHRDRDQRLTDKKLYKLANLYPRCWYLSVRARHFEGRDVVITEYQITNLNPCRLDELEAYHNQCRNALIAEIDPDTLIDCGWFARALTIQPVPL